MAPASGNDTLSAAPVSKIGSQSQQELSNGSTLTASTGGVPASTGRFMKDVAAQLPLPQQSPTSKDKAVAAIMRQQEVEAKGPKITGGNDLSKSLEGDDNGDKTPHSAKKAAELSPCKGGQSFGS